MDIADTREAAMDDALSANEPEFFHALLEQMGTFAVLDKEGRYLYVNSAWVKQMNCPLERAIGRHVTEFYADTRSLEAMRGKKPILAHPIRANEGQPETRQQFTSYLPLFQDGETAGCIIQTIFHDVDEAMEFSEVLARIRGERNYYRQELRRMQGAKYSIEHIIGKSPAIQGVKRNIRLAARSISNVLIEGETGTGKELVAHSIHGLSGRARLPMIQVNCAAIPLELAEAELFGYEYGAFTGAKAGGKIGKFELADKSTLFFDEINQLAAAIQPKLLRVLQEKEVERLGGNKNKPLDVRLIAATNVPLEELVDAGSFRNDLYYRLNVIHIRVPPLRERLEDLPLAVEEIITRLNSQLGTRVEGVDSEVLERFAEYSWKGNMRELQNIMERAINEKPHGVLTWPYFTGYFQQVSRAPAEARAAGNSSYRAARKQLERSVILDALDRFGGNKKRTAEFLEISRTMLYRKLHEYGIE